MKLGIGCLTYLRAMTVVSPAGLALLLLAEDGLCFTNRSFLLFFGRRLDSILCLLQIFILLLASHCVLRSSDHNFFCLGSISSCAVYCLYIGHITRLRLQSHLLFLSLALFVRS